jgi:hypothetical protein
VASCVVRPLDRPCEAGVVTALLGSAVCSVVGAVLCVVGVVCTLDAVPTGEPAAVLCVVGVVCTGGALCAAVPVLVVGAVCGVVPVSGVGAVCGVAAPGAV